MSVYVAFPVAMFAIFNMPVFYEDAIYQARLAIQSRRDEQGADSLKRYLNYVKQENLRRSIEEREAGIKCDD